MQTLIKWLVCWVGNYVLKFKGINKENLRKNFKKFVAKCYNGIFFGLKIKKEKKILRRIKIKRNEKTN